MSKATILWLHFFFRLTPFLFLLLLPFLQQLKHSRLRTTFYGLLSFILIIVLSVLCNIGVKNNITIHYFYVIASTITGFLLLYTCVNTSHSKILFTLFLGLCYADDVSAFAWIIKSLLMETTPSLHEYTAAFYGTIIVLTVTFPLIVYFNLRFIRPLITNEETSPYWNYLWLLPCIGYFLYAIAIDIQLLRATKQITYYNLFFLQLTWTFGTFTSCGILLKMLQEINIKQTLRTKLETSTLQLALERKEFVKLKELILTVKRDRHDIRQHFNILANLAQTNNCSEIYTYVANCLETTPPLARDIFLCENYAINALTNYYLAKAKEAKIDFKTSLELPETLAIPESDIATLLGNMLENAIQACQKQTTGKKFITLKAAVINKTLLAISVCNSFTEPVQTKNGAFLSSKLNFSAEGLGTLSIRNTAERYGGIANFSYAHNVFEASVLLNNK